MSVPICTKATSISVNTILGRGERNSIDYCKLRKDISQAAKKGDYEFVFGQIKWLIDSAEAKGNADSLPPDLASLYYSIPNASPKQYLDLTLKHLPQRFKDQILKAKNKNDYDQAINETLQFVVYYLSLIRTESKYNPKHQNPSGARGLGQLMQKTAQTVATSLGMKSFDLLNSSDSIKISINYFADLYKDKGTLERAILAYKRGAFKTDYPINSPLWIEVNKSAQGTLKYHGQEIKTKLEKLFSFPQRPVQHAPLPQEPFMSS